MADKKQGMNKKEMVMIAVVLLIAVLSLVILHFTRSSGDSVVITLDGAVYGTYDLGKNQVIYLEEADGTNTVKIQDGTVSMIEASCPDQICVHSAPLTKEAPGMIVCLPHKIVVEIKE